MGSLIECRDLSKNYGITNALSGLNLTLEQGKITGLLGPNGCGKTTLIKLIAGLLVPTDGKVLIDGKEPGMETKKIVSYLPDKDYLHEWMKISELVGLFSDFYEDFDSVKAYDMLKSLKIDKNKRLKTLSKGTREKLQLSLVMSRQAKVYLLDEPIGGVDPSARDYIIRTIITNYREDSGVIITTHLIHDIESVLDDVVVLENGTLREHSDADTMREKYGMSVDAVFRGWFRC